MSRARGDATADISIDGRGPGPSTVRIRSLHAGAVIGRWLRNGDVAFGLSVGFSRLVVGLLITQVGVGILPRGPFLVFAGNRLSGFLGWDSTWYLGLANGYTTARATVFFPGYPVAVHLAHMATGNHVSLEVVGLVISWAAFLISVPMLQALTQQLCSRKVARLAVVLYAWSPASVFLLAAYPVGCYVLLSAAALLALGRGRLLTAAFLAGLCTAFASFGVCVAVAVAIVALRGRSLWKGLILTAVSVWGIAAWVLWLTLRFHDPLVFMTQQSTFNRSSVPPFSGIVGVIMGFGNTHGTPAGVPVTNFEYTKLLNLAFALLGLALFIYYVVDLLSPRLRRFPAYFSAFAALSFLVPALSIQTFAGVPNPEAATRHTTQNAGLYPALSLLLLNKQWLLVPVLSLWVALAAVFQLVFSLGWYFT